MFDAPQWFQSLSRQFGWRSQMWPLLVLAVVAGLAGQARGQVSQLVWTDAASGLAIGGIDPMSYFILGRPKIGLERHEVVWRGASWRFANAANRHAFMTDPLIYVPRFGGHGAMALSQGHSNAGNPAIWYIRGNKLYLFFSRAARRKWLKEPDRHIVRADRNWPGVRLQLVK